MPACFINVIFNKIKVLWKKNSFRKYSWSSNKAKASLMMPRVHFLRTCYTVARHYSNTDSTPFILSRINSHRMRHRKAKLTVPHHQTLNPETHVCHRMLRKWCLSSDMLSCIAIDKPAIELHLWLPISTHLRIFQRFLESKNFLHREKASISWVLLYLTYFSRHKYLLIYAATDIYQHIIQASDPAGTSDRIFQRNPGSAHLLLHINKTFFFIPRK